MNIWWQLAIVVAIVWLVLRFVRSLFKSREPSESVEEILWRVYHRPRDAVRKIDLAPWRWQSPMRKTRIAVFSLAICKTAFLRVSVSPW